MTRNNFDKIVVEVAITIHSCPHIGLLDTEQLQYLCASVSLREK